VEIAGHEQVEPAVVVVVEKAGAGAPSAGGDAGTGGDVGERPVAHVAVQGVAAVVGHVDVGEAVVIVIAGGRAHAVLVLRSAADGGPGRDILERPGTRLPVQTIPETRDGF